jgi:hypothetical protein
LTRLGIDEAPPRGWNRHLAVAGIADLDLIDRPRRVYLPDHGTLGFQRLASVNIHAA